MPLLEEDVLLPYPSNQDSLNISTNIVWNSSMIMFDTFDYASLSIAVLSVIFAITVASNMFALVVLSRREKLSRMHYFIVHLCLADILVAGFNVLPEILKQAIFPFRGGAFLCKAVSYLQVYVLYLSAYILVMTAIDRYIALCHPIANQSWSAKRVKVMIAAAWCLAALMAIPQLVVWKWYDNISMKQNRLDRCWAEFHPTHMWMAYVMYFLGMIYVVPFFLLAFCYGRICYVVHTNGRRRQHCRPKSPGNNNATKGREGLLRVHSTANYNKTRLKTVKLSAVVMLTYLLCWLPYFVVHTWTLGGPERPVEALHPLQVVANFLASLNSCCNPWIYFVFTGIVCCNKRPSRRERDLPSRFLRSNASNETEVFVFRSCSMSISKSNSSKSDDGYECMSKSTMNQLNGDEAFTAVPVNPEK